MNNIYIRSRRQKFPEHISSLVDRIGRDRDSPGPSADDIRDDNDLEFLEMGAPGADVQSYFQAEIFPRSVGASVRSERLPMAKSALPDIVSNFKISTPVPDILYGYSNVGAFAQQQAQLISMGTGMFANSQDSIFPFFAIEFKGDGPGGSGSLWVATNRCFGSSTSCVNVAERLNCQLKQCNLKGDQLGSVNSAAFSIAMNGTEARLYVSWKHNDLAYHTQKVKSFLLQETEQYLEFHKYVRNIIDWGNGTRLNEIRKSLDSLQEANRRVASQLAKSRTLSTDEPAGSSSQKCKA